MTFLPDLTSGRQGRGAARGGQLGPAAGFAPQAAALKTKMARDFDAPSHNFSTCVLPPFHSRVRSQRPPLYRPITTCQREAKAIPLISGTDRAEICGPDRVDCDGTRFAGQPFLANAATCSSVCHFAFGRAIHSRMIFRRVSWSFIFAVPWLSCLGQQGASAHDLRPRQVCRASHSAAVKFRQRVAASTRTPG
jgi:hypothetical protein